MAPHLCLTRDQRTILAALVVCALTHAPTAMVFASPDSRVGGPLGPASMPTPKDIATLNTQVAQLETQQKPLLALQLSQRFLANQRRTYGDEHDHTLAAMRLVAKQQAKIGDFMASQTMYGRVIATIEKREGKDHAALVEDLIALAATHLDAADAARLYDRARRIAKRAYGQKDDRYLRILLDSALYTQNRYSYVEAEKMYDHALAIYEKRDGEESDGVESVLSRKALLYASAGDRTRASRVLGQLEAMIHKRHATNPSRLAGGLSGLLYPYKLLTNTAKLRRLGERIVAAHQATKAQMAASLGRSHAAVRSFDMMIAGAWLTTGHLTKAERLYPGILRTVESQYGKNSHMVLSVLGNLEEVYAQQRRYKQALSISRRRVGVYKKLGYHYLSASLVHQQSLYRERLGQYDRAIALTTNAWQSLRRVYGDKSPTTADLRAFQAQLHFAQGRYQAAFQDLVGAYPVIEAYARLFLPSATEEDGRKFIARRIYLMHLAVTLHANHMRQDDAAARLSMSAVLTYKGRLLDSMAGGIRNLRKRLNKHDRQLLDQLSAARARLAKLAVSGPQGNSAHYAKEVARLEDQIRKLEVEVSKKSAAFRAQGSAVDLDKIQKALPGNTTLIEMIAYRRFDPRASKGAPLGTPDAPAATYLKEKRYGAYILKPSGAPIWIDIGTTRQVDALITKLRRALASPSAEHVQISKALHQKVFAKIAKHLSNTPHVLIAPDGALNLVPFGALMDNDGKHLIQTHTITYLSSGRDLLRLQVNAGSHGKPVIIVDPDFDGKAGETRGDSTSRGRLSRSLRDANWGRLAGTAQEGRAIARILRGARLFSRRRATEQQVKNVHGPRILHLATHGFFLPGAVAEELAIGLGSTRGLQVVGAPKQGSEHSTVTENPLLRSGLVLSSANRPSTSGEDGVLTALEVADLDLWGTQLVVLSACETGVGEVTDGDGIYGLRRALVLGGAESQLMSLWKVNDAATRDLMIDYYRRIHKGKGRSEALRNTQLQMLEGKRSHPYYWASFILAGQWQPLVKN